MKIQPIGAPCRCGRRDCQARSLGAKAVSLRFPESMRVEVTAAQDECDALFRARKAMS